MRKRFTWALGRIPSMACLILAISGLLALASNEGRGAERSVANVEGSTPSAKGWLLVRFGKSTSSLAAFTRVDLKGTAQGMHSFTVSEGPYRGTAGTVASSVNGMGTLTTYSQLKGPATITYRRSDGILTIESGTASVSFKATMDPKNLLADGTYPVGLPDAPHSVGSSLSNVEYSRTWFPIITPTSDKLRGQRFLHTGSVSLGCMTVTDTARWKAAYTYLITSRAGDGKTIGVLKVVSR